MNELTALTVILDHLTWEVARGGPSWEVRMAYIQARRQIRSIRPDWYRLHRTDLRSLRETIGRKR